MIRPVGQALRASTRDGGRTREVFDGKHLHRSTQGEKAMDTGPVDVVIFESPGNEFNGDLLPALRELAAAKTVRILDILFVIKDADE